MKFTVKRSKWARGGKNGKARLRNKDGNMCCLGFVCRKLGAKVADINQQYFPSNTIFNSKFLETFPSDPETGRMFENIAAHINDDADLAPNTREAHLKELFRSRGHKIVFVP